MQRIEIDNIVNNLKNDIETPTSNSSKLNPMNLERFGLNINYLVYDKNNFLSLWNANNNEIREIIYHQYDATNNFITNLKKRFLEKLQKKWIFTCSYCGKTSNIHWEFYDKLVRLYDIEHFLPRSRYQLLAINLYNWLPVCKACNQTLKSDVNTLWSTDKNNKIFHPYFWWIYRDWNEIRVDNSTFDEKVTFVWNPQPEIDWKEQVYKTHHWKFFRLWEIYLKDQETFNIFDFIYDKIPKILDEYQRFKESSKTIEEFIDYFFNEYYPKEEQDILKYSNWKLKKDLIQYLTKILEEETLTY